MIPNTPTELQLDALREVANVGCGHAANALSALVGGRVVQIDVPRVRLLPVTDLPDAIGGADAKVIASGLDVRGALTGRILFVMPEPDAHQLLGLLLRRTVSGELEPDAQDAMNEVANIVASACLSAIGELTQLKLLPSVPTLVQDNAEVVVEQLLSRQRGERLMMLEASFSTRTAPSFTGQLVVLPDPESLGRLLASLGV